MGFAIFYRAGAAFGIGIHALCTVSFAEKSERNWPNCRGRRDCFRARCRGGILICAGSNAYPDAHCDTHPDASIITHPDANAIANPFANPFHGQF
jgi:hypothetical protein